MRVRLSRAAEDDLAAIFDFTMARWGESQAEIYLAGLHDRIASIGSGVGLAIGDGLMRLRYRAHFLFVARDAEGLILVRVLHGAMDMPSHLP